jgi:hypothetical protein
VLSVVSSLRFSPHLSLWRAEIPPELEAELHIKALIEAFVLQLQVLLEMRDEIFNLYTSGHFDYQESYVSRFRFRLEALPTLQTELDQLREQLNKWQAIVKDVCERSFVCLLLSISHAHLFRVYRRVKPTTS